MNELVPPTQGLRVDQFVPNSHIWHNDYPTMNLNHMNHAHARTILTLLPGDKMPAISRDDTFNAFSSMKTFIFWFEFTEVCSWEPSWQ